MHVKEDNLRISKIFLFPKSDNIKSVKWICYDCKWLWKSFYLSSFFGDFLSHTECPTAPLAFSRERWMLILHFGSPRAMVSQNEKSPSLWDGIIWLRLTVLTSELVWNGEQNIASIRSTAGYWQNHKLQKLFDYRPDSFWLQNEQEVIGSANLIIEFISPIHFHRLVLGKRYDFPDETKSYKDICLRNGCFK